jgi:toxin ParE1/3/4
MAVVLGEERRATATRMRISFSAQAIGDLRHIRNFIAEENPQAASRVATKLIAACDALQRFPARGRPGTVPGTRELTSVPPYIIVYEVTAFDVVIIRIWHGARDRIPPLP